MEKKPLKKKKGLLKRIKEGIDDPKNRWWFGGRWFVLVSLSGLGLFLTLKIYVELPKLVLKEPRGWGYNTPNPNIYGSISPKFWLVHWQWGKKKKRKTQKDMTKWIIL
ncbi:MAG: hypothetical protein CM15mL6_080 [uncultured marine virus]|nr:MAG: hypothetical protein CM15mL6_080 [uncultured marine virus]